MRNISDGITLKHWFKVVEKIEQFDFRKRSKTN